jgi:hypothetical protein
MGRYHLKLPSGLCLPGSMYYLLHCDALRSALGAMRFYPFLVKPFSGNFYPYLVKPLMGNAFPIFPLNNEPSVGRLHENISSLTSAQHQP